MQCTECKNYTSDLWLTMKNHYRKKHPDVNPHQYFTKTAKARTNEVSKLERIKKIADKTHEDRYDIDWDELQGSLYKIWEIVHNKKHKYND